MCGLVGILHLQQQDSSRLEHSVRAMADTLVHRGPDDHGAWVNPERTLALGFRRLAILDLSPTGHQPMTSPSGRFTIVFNGEVYNHERLRKDLGGGRLRGGSDTEVVLHAFDQWGPRRALDRFIGMFAMAVWDEREQELWLVRDRMGIKPLYVARTSSGMAFASELRALRKAPGFDSSLDLDGVHSFLQYLYFPAPHTPYSSVRKLLPGHFLRVSANRLATEGIPASEPWWTLDGARRTGTATASGRPPAPESALVDELEELLIDAVGLRMIADVPVGALLSGGIDSSMIVALMQQQVSHPVRTFTIGFDDPAHDESVHARRVADHIGTDHTELVLTGEDALKLIPAAPRIFDEPLADPSQLPTFLVCELARRSVTVALSGDGGDELFAGYNRHVAGGRILPRVSRLPRTPRRWLGGLLRSVPTGTWERGREWIPGPAGRLRLAGAKAHKLGRLLQAPSESEMYRTLLRTGIDPSALLRNGTHTLDPVREGLDQLGGRPVTLADMLYSDQRHYLPDDLLQKVDRASMAVSLEARVPLLDHRVVEFSWSLPDHMKIRDGQGKWLLRRVLDRYVPGHLLDRPKTGFTVPVERWLAGPLREWGEDLLLSPDPVRDALFHPDALARSWKRFRAGRVEEAMDLWAILTLLSWRAHWGVDNLTDRAA